MIEHLLLALIMAAVFGCGARFGYLLAIRRQMRTECAWCKIELTPGREPTSHGICTICFIRQMEEMGAIQVTGEFRGPIELEAETSLRP